MSGDKGTVSSATESAVCRMDISSLAYRKGDARSIAESFLSGAHRGALYRYAVEYIVLIIEEKRRSIARKSEEDSVTPINRPSTQIDKPYNRKAISKAISDGTESQFIELRDNPGTRIYLRGKAQRQSFRKWMGDGFDEWYRQARELVYATKDEREIDWFMSDWDEGYTSEKHMRSLLGIVQEFADTMRLEITRELLATEFALGDGVRVTWGDATVDQHKQRIELLQANALANTEAAARHMAALRMIAEKGVRCLGEIGEVD